MDFFADNDCGVVFDCGMHNFCLKTMLNFNMTAKIEKMDRIINCVKSKMEEIFATEIEECLYNILQESLFDNNVA